MIDLIKQNWELLLGTFGTIGAYFGGRKLKKAEEKKATSDALDTMQKTYDTFVADFRERYTELKEELKQYRVEQVSLRQEVNQLRTENNELRKEIKDWEGKYTKLKKEFDTHKKNA